MMKIFNKFNLSKKKTILLICVSTILFILLLVSEFTGAVCFFLCLKSGLLTLDSFRTGAVTLLFLFLMSLCFWIIVALVISCIYLRPLKRLTDSTKKVASGDFSVRFELNGLENSNQLLQSLNAMVEELGSMETLRDDFVSNISHEFKTPIASIHGFARLLKKGNLSAEQQNEYLDIILSESERLSTMSKNILLLSKLDNTPRLTDVTTFPLDEQIRRTLLILNRQMEEKNIDLDFEMERHYISGNEELLTQVWINLLGNAIKFTGNGGTIVVLLKKSDDRIMVSIKDTGIGMSPDTLKHIFDKFYQGDHSRSSQGNGLGLSLVKKIVELHNGTIEANSEEGLGSEFIVTLPLVR